MSVRAIQSRILCDRNVLEQLWHTHSVFNQRLPAILKVLFSMRRGECGMTSEERAFYQLIARFVLARSSRDAPYLLNSVSIIGWKPNTALKQTVTLRNKNGSEIEIAGSAWAEEAAARSHEGKLLYDKKHLLGDLPDTLRQMIVREAVAIMSSYDESVHRWEDAHDAWLKQKAEWEAVAEHQRYLVVRSEFEKFEKEAGGPAAKRRGRWDKYLRWLQVHPELASWRGGASQINTLSPKTVDRIRRSKSWKRTSVEAEEFWKANPELKELDRLHGYYEREFVRRRKGKRNPDGFYHRPTFTLPHPQYHPRWFVFNAPQSKPRGYAELKLPQRSDGIGSVELRLLTGPKIEEEFPSDWVKIRFKGDPRLRDFKQCKVKRTASKGSIKGQATEKTAYQFTDQQLNLRRNAQISGAKLIFKRVRLNPDGSLCSAIPYLIFTCNIDDVSATERAKELKWIESEAVTESGKRRKNASIPNGLVACAVHLGIRNLGFATVAKYQHGKPHVFRSRNIWVGNEEKEGSHPGRWSAGPDLAHVARHQLTLRKLHRLRGKPVVGERSHVTLQSHITCMGEDRFKKGARSIINFALNVDDDKSGKTEEPYPRADVLLVPRLAGLIPDAERERAINRALAAWNRGQLLDRLKELARDTGLKIVEVSSFATSQVCSRCGSLGRTYSIRVDKETHSPDIHFGWVEKLFACRCGYSANANHNASINLHRRFLLGDPAVQAYAVFRSKTEREQRAMLARIEGELLPTLRRMHGLKIAPLAPEGSL